MKKIMFIFFFLFILINTSAFASDSLRISYYIIHKTDYKILKLTIEVNDSTDITLSNNTSTFLKAENNNLYDLPNKLDTETISNKIVNQIKENKDIEFYKIRPDYFNDILNLFTDSLSKEKAMDIYDKHFNNSFINISNSSSNSTISSSSNNNTNKIKTYKYTIYISINLKIKKNTKLILNSINFFELNKYHNTYKLEINLEN